MRSYQEMVVGPMKQMSEDNQQLLLYKNKIAVHQQHEKALQQTMGVISKQLRITSEENRIVRQRTTTQHQENKEQMDYMEHFFNQLATIQETTDAKELLQEEQEKLSNDSGGKEEDGLRRDEIAWFTESQKKGVEGFEVEKARLEQEYEDEKTELERKHLADKVKLQKKFNDAWVKLMDKYNSSEPSASS